MRRESKINKINFFKYFEKKEKEEKKGFLRLFIYQKRYARTVRIWSLEGGNTKPAPKICNALFFYLIFYLFYFLKRVQLTSKARLR